MLVAVIFLISSYLAVTQTSSFIISSLARISLLLFRTPTPALVVISILLLPGTILHELAHALTATFLGVRVGQVHIFPEFKSETSNLALGHVAIAKADPIRTTIIGFAPTLIGSTFMFGILSMLIPGFYSQTPQEILMALLASFRASPYLAASILYLTFAIASSFHTSPSDRRSFPVFIVIALSLSLLIYLTVGFSLIPSSIYSIFTTIALTLASGYTLATALNLLISLPLFLLIPVISKLTGRRIITKPL